jgi:hypothetical protein
MFVNEEELDMDIVWLLAAVAFFVGCHGVVRFFGNLRAED